MNAKQNLSIQSYIEMIERVIRKRIQIEIRNESNETQWKKYCYRTVMSEVHVNRNNNQKQEKYNRQQSLQQHEYQMPIKSRHKFFAKNADLNK